METFEELQALSDAEIVARMNQGIQHVSAGVSFYTELLHQRHAARQATAITRLTVVIALLTLANVALVAVDVLR